MPLQTVTADEFGTLARKLEKSGIEYRNTSTDTINWLVLDSLVGDTLVLRAGLLGAVRRYQADVDFIGQPHIGE